MRKETTFTSIILTVDQKYVHNVADIYIYMLISSDDRIDGGGGLATYTRHVTEAARQLTALVPCMSQYSRGRSTLTPPRSRSTFALELETNLRQIKVLQSQRRPTAGSEIAFLKKIQH